MTILVNGQPHRLVEPMTLAAVVARYAPSPVGIAVARNREVIPRSQWETTNIVSGDRIEIVTAVAGG
jgi:sulfur carrier protein